MGIKGGRLCVEIVFIRGMRFMVKLKSSQKGENI